jgi:hypothetical protein
MRNETKAKLVAFTWGIFALPLVVGIIVVLTYIRKVSSDFWLNVFGF